jgi:hypothetical protein
VGPVNTVVHTSLLTVLRKEVVRAARRGGYI